MTTLNDPAQPHEPPTTDEHFGGCPICGKTDGYVDHNWEHWFCCDQHRVRWCAGWNLFSSCKELQSAAELASTAKVMAFDIVEPVRMPVTPSEPSPVRPPTTREEFWQQLEDMMRENEP